MVLDTPASAGLLAGASCSRERARGIPLLQVCCVHPALPSLQHLPGLLSDVCSLHDGLKGVGREKEPERDRDCVCPLSKA